MATLARRGAGTPATTGTTWASVTNAVDGTAGTNPATYSTMTNATASAVATIEITGYAFSDTVGASDTLNSVSVALRHFENNTGRFASVVFQAFDGATSIGTATTCTLATGARTDTATVAATLTQLRSSTFKIRVTVTGAASTQSRIFSIDQVDVTADYTPLPPSITQAAYRWYDDGTETGAVALAAQDTAATGDVTVNDGIGQLRVRLQSTNAGVLPATDDYQLQYDKNASGTWTNVADQVITNLVPNPSIEVNTTGWAASVNGTIARDTGKGGAIADSGSAAVAATSTAAGLFYIVNASPYIPISPSTQYYASGYIWTLVTTTVRFYVAYYTSGGVYISDSSIVGGTATSSAWARKSLAFTTPSNAGNVRLTFERTAGAGSEQFWVDAVMLTAGSTLYNYFDGSTAGASWSGTAHNSVSTFPIPATTVGPYNSASLTDGAVTTNRLGAGTGTFVAGKVSEDGVVDNVGWTANNYTELVFSLALKKADLVNGDTLTFRVLRNGATTGITYTAVPTINVAAVAVTTGTALITQSVDTTAAGVRTTFGTALTSTAVDVTATATRTTFGTALIEITGNTSATVGAVITTGTALLTQSVTVDATGTVIAEIVTGTALLTQSVDVTVAGTVVAEVVSGTALISSGVAVTAAGTVIAEVVTGTALLTQSVAVTVAGTVVAEIVTGTAAFTSSVAVTVAGTVVAEVVTGTALLSSSVTITAAGTSFSPGGGTALISVPVAITAQGTVVAEVVTGTALLSAAVSVTTAGARTGTGTAALTASVAVTAIGTRAAVTAGTALLASAVVIDATGTVIAEVVSGTASITASVSIVVSVLKVYERAPYTATWSLVSSGTLEVDARATYNLSFAGGWDTNGRATVDHDYAHSWELV